MWLKQFVVALCCGHHAGPELVVLSTEVLRGARGVDWMRLLAGIVPACGAREQAGGVEETPAAIVTALAAAGWLRRRAARLVAGARHGRADAGRDDTETRRD